ncbi:MAG: DUF1080 domain-containing protein [Verrucomicrobiales bacterium]|nr:DUF1080 domain-containing protein [Verrucomicrobiales bacterium]
MKLISWLVLLLVPVSISISKEKRLSEYGFSDDKDGALSLLGLLNQKQDRKLLAKYVSELDSNDFSKRERASLNLSRLPVIDRTFLEESLNGSNPEVSFRIRSILKQNNKERFDGMIRALSYEIIRGKHEGLLSDLFSSVEDREQYSMGGMWRSFAEASIVTADVTDVQLLKLKLISDNDMIRYSSVKTLLSLLGQKSLPLIEKNIKDQNSHIKWECANAFMKFQRRECLVPLAELLMCDEDFGLRWRSLESLRNITGQEFGYYAAGNAEERSVPATKWKDWIKKNSASAKLNFGVLDNNQAVALFNGKNFEDWEFRNLGGGPGVIFGRKGQVPDEDTWDIENQNLIAKKGFRSEIITKQSFLNYEFSLEYKLEGVSDSGVGIFAGDADKGYLEIQLYNQTSGDLYKIGAAQIVTDDGNPLAFRSTKFKDSNEVKDEWNRMVIRVSDGQSEIKVNGEVQNRALSKEAKPSKIVLRNEGTGKVEFRNLLLKKL